MCSPKVTPGTAAAFGGVTDRLQQFGIPAACCSDGPSGIRMDCGTMAYALPNGTLLACTFDPELVEDDGADRGLYFIGLSAKAHETLEFMQQEWINHGNFVDLADERDPIVGQQPEGATFTVPERPVRRRIHGIHSFCTLQGGEYLFMPGLRALRRLAGA